MSAANKSERHSVAPARSVTCLRVPLEALKSTERTRGAGVCMRGRQVPSSARRGSVVRILSGCAVGHIGGGGIGLASPVGWKAVFLVGHDDDRFSGAEWDHVLNEGVRIGLLYFCELVVGCVEHLPADRSE